MIRVTLEDRIPWTIVVLFKGDKYGRDNCLTHKEDKPLVEFYDRRYDFDRDINNVVLGQFVSRYYLHTLIKREGNCGLDLMGDQPNWKISAEGMEQVRNFLRTDFALLKFT